MIMLQPYLYEIIQAMVKDRQERRVFPYIAVETEIMRQVQRDVKETLDEMEADGLIAHHENLNGIRMFRNTKGQDPPVTPQSQI